MDVFEFVGSIGGIGGVLGLITFLTYRHLVSQMREDRTYMEKNLTNVIAEYNTACRSHTEAMVKNTEILTELIVWLQARNGHS